MEKLSETQSYPHELTATEKLEDVEELESKATPDVVLFGQL